MRARRPSRAARHKARNYNTVLYYNRVRFFSRRFVSTSSSSPIRYFYCAATGTTDHTTHVRAAARAGRSDVTRGRTDCRTAYEPAWVRALRFTLTALYRAPARVMYRLTLTSSFAINKLLTKRPRLRAVRHHSPRRVSSGSNAQWCLCAARLTTLCGRPAAYDVRHVRVRGSALCSTLWHGLLAPRKNALGHIHSLRGQRRGMVAAARRLSPRSSVIRKRGALQLVQPIRCCKQL